MANNISRKDKKCICGTVLVLLDLWKKKGDPGWVLYWIIEQFARSDILHLVSLCKLQKRRSYRGYIFMRNGHLLYSDSEKQFLLFRLQYRQRCFKFLMLRTDISKLWILAEQAGVVLPVDDNPAAREKMKRQVLEKATNLAKGFLINYRVRRGLQPGIICRQGSRSSAVGKLSSRVCSANWRSAELSGAKWLPTAGYNRGRPGDQWQNRPSPTVFATGLYFQGMQRTDGWFGGQVLGDTLPKYLNSPKRLFSKSGPCMTASGQTVYRRKRLCCGGGRLHGCTHGLVWITNTVATGYCSYYGTRALVVEQYCNVIFAFDADVAGVAATMGLDILRGGLWVSAEHSEGKSWWFSKTTRCRLEELIGGHIIEINFAVCRPGRWSPQWRKN